MPSISSQPHSRLIQQAAKEIPAPIGIFQRGRSRTWIDDHGWWLVIIEFQPSSWSKGSYLNVGAMWLWSEKSYFSFDVGSRVERLVTYESETQFAPEAHRLALSAREQVLNLREQFPSIAPVAQFLQQQALRSEDPWRLFHAGVALGYLGQISDACACFAMPNQQQPEYNWQEALHANARQLAELLGDPLAFKKRVDKAIRTTRKLLKLREMPDLVIS